MTFRDFTVEENLKVGAFTLKDKKVIKANFERVYKYFPVLKERKSQVASTLSGGEQQMLAIARALMSSPKILLLDEPFAGVDPIAVSDIQNIVKELAHLHIGVLITDHNVRETLAICDRAYVLKDGSLLASGKSSEVADNKLVKTFYLGEDFRF